jgi:hypothetical protein
VAVGGGIFAQGELNIVRSDINDNFAAGGGGLSADGTINIVRSAIYGNSAVGASGLQVSGTVKITNSTVGRNVTDPLSTSEAILLGSGLLTITNSTIADNVMAGATGTNVGIRVGPAGVVQLQNTILALNLSLAGTPQDCDGSLTSLGNNIIGTTFNCSIDLRPSDLVGDPRLGPLTSDAEGNVFFPLLADSPAIDTANPAACPRRDQLGRPRADGNGDGRKFCDIGAVEFIP